MINLPVFETITILFFYMAFKWLFRGFIVFAFIKVLEGLKERTANDIKAHMETLKRGKEEK